MRRKIINCINNCENILSAVFFSPRAREISLLPQQFGRFSATLSLLPSINKRKHVFSSAENFSSSSEANESCEKPRSQEFAGSQAERNIFRIHLCALALAFGKHQGEFRGPQRPLSICCLIVAGSVPTDLWRWKTMRLHELWNVSSIFHSRVNKKKLFCFRLRRISFFGKEIEQFFTVEARNRVAKPVLNGRLGLAFDSRPQRVQICFSFSPKKIFFCEIKQKRIHRRGSEDNQGQRRSKSLNLL